MLFDSLGFLTFLAVVWPLYALLTPRWRRWILLLASWAFYALWDWRFLPLLLASTAVDFVCAQRVAGHRGWLVASVVANLAILGVFKYARFVAENLGLPDPELPLPVGLSFYTFQSMSYTIDVSRGRLRPEPRFLDFALYVAFFPQLVAGPIERATSLLPQLRAPGLPSRDEVREGLWLILWGYFLKGFVADNLANVVDPVYAVGGPREGPLVLLATYAFAWQLLGDFAGYSAIAIGVARLFGVRLSPNFLFPYLATSPRELWRNWHISLSTWLRDYLYLPLGGNRRARNLVITMLLGGLWHGAAWHFVAWGGYHGALLAAQRALPLRLPRALAVIGTFHLTCLGWVLFRAPTIGEAGALLASLGNIVWSPAAGDAAARLGFHVAPFAALQAYNAWKGDPNAVLGWSPGRLAALSATLLWLLLVFGDLGGRPFVYFAF